MIGNMAVSLPCSYRAMRNSTSRKSGDFISFAVSGSEHPLLLKSCQLKHQRINAVRSPKLSYCQVPVCARWLLGSCVLRLKSSPHQRANIPQIKVASHRHPKEVAVVGVGNTHVNAPSCSSAECGAELRQNSQFYRRPCARFSPSIWGSGVAGSNARVLCAYVRSSAGFVAKAPVLTRQRER